MFLLFGLTAFRSFPLSSFTFRWFAFCRLFDWFTLYSFFHFAFFHIPHLPSLRDFVFVVFPHLYYRKQFAIIQFYSCQWLLCITSKKKFCDARVHACEIFFKKEKRCVTRATHLSRRRSDFIVALPSASALLRFRDQLSRDCFERRTLHLVMRARLAVVHLAGAVPERLVGTEPVLLVHDNLLCPGRLQETTFC